MTLPVSRISITGGRGRLASLLSRHFSTRGHPITLFSREPGENILSLESLLATPRFAAADVLFHLAWSTLPATSEHLPFAESQADLILLRRLLDSISALPESQRPLFVFFSSGGAIYGNAPGRSSRENDPCRPIGAYGRAKFAAEKLLDSYLKQGLRGVILRVSNPYGHTLPASRPQGIISHALRCIQTGEKLNIWGDGTAKKDYLYHTDFTAALECVVDLKLQGVFNLSAGKSHSVNKIIALLEAITGKTLRVAHSPAQSWDVQDSRIDPDKFSQATGWTSKVDLETGVGLMAKATASII